MTAARPATMTSLIGFGDTDTGFTNSKKAGNYINNLHQSPVLLTKQAVLVVEMGRAIGVITRHDVIEKR